MRRAALAFLCAGSLAAAAGTLVPDPDPSDHGALLGLSIACAVLALVLAVWRRPPDVVLALWGERGVRMAVYIGTAIPVLCVAVVVATLGRRVDEHVDGLHDIAETDTLTGLLNHGACGAALEDLLDHGGRTGETATLLLLDIDHFKRANDRYGHLQGDRTLRVVSEVLTAHKRRGDLLGRVGGEEFGLLLPDAGLDAAHGVAERVRVALRDATASTPCPLTVSIGIATVSPSVATSHALLHAADRARYAAKARGRDRAVDLEPVRAVAA